MQQRLALAIWSQAVGSRVLCGAAAELGRCVHA